MYDATVGEILGWSAGKADRDFGRPPMFVVAQCQFAESIGVPDDAYRRGYAAGFSGEDATQRALMELVVAAAIGSVR